MLDGIGYDDSGFVLEMSADSFLHDSLCDMHVKSTERIIHQVDISANESAKIGGITFDRCIESGPVWFFACLKE